MTKILLPTKDQVSNISSTLGSTGDTGGGDSTGSISAKLNKIIQYVDTVESTLSTLNTRTSTMNTNINTIKNNTSNVSSIIRRIQRDMVYKHFSSVDGSGTSYSLNISLSGFTNMDKMLVFITDAIGPNKTSVTLTHSLQSIDNLYLLIPGISSARPSEMYIRFTYQVVEFY